MPMNDKHKRPTPHKGCCPWPTRPKTSYNAGIANRATPKRYDCVSVRFVLVHSKFADFKVRTRAKLSIFRNKISLKFEF